MSAVPKWFEQLRWSATWSVVALANNRQIIPEQPGCYVFTDDAGGLRPNHVLYVGKATNLRNRLGGYLVSYINTRPTKHKGRAFVFEQRARTGDHATFVRWVVYGGKPGELESNLCDFLWPHCTDRWETHELWEDDETIDPRLLL
jgi:hypothetical protein